MERDESSAIRLTQYSHGAGCGCKISPGVLVDILTQEQGPATIFPDLLVGNEDSDDAAVLDLGDGTALISTTDFFMPIVDDPFDYGRIASVNAISDVYAMGGTPLMAIAVLGWPIAKLESQVAASVLQGARAVCQSINIPLAGGHSIDCPEPIFGLAVTGRVAIDHLKQNNGARPGDVLFLTKPLGVGILATAEKKAILRRQDTRLAKDSMLRLNSIGQTLAEQQSVHALTDVTGFGLAGHLLEMCKASAVRAAVDFSRLPVFEPIQYYIDQGCLPGGVHRNFESYGEHLSALSESQRAIICDPQTSGGLLLAVDPEDAGHIAQLLEQAECCHAPVGCIEEYEDGQLYIEVT